MTTLFIAYSDIPKSSVRSINSNNFTSTDLENTSHPLINSVDGERHSVFKTTQAGGVQYHTFDLGPTNTKASDFIALARADQLMPITGNLTIRLRSSADTSSWTTELEITNFENVTLLGPNAQDYINMFAPSSAYRYWQTQLSYSAGTLSGAFSKLFFGTILDLGTDPEDYETSYIYADSSFKANDGSAHLYRTFPPLVETRIRWAGVSDTLTESFNTKVSERRFLSTFFLYASSYTPLLMGETLLHCKCTYAQTTNEEGRPDSNTIEATFVEVKG